MGDEGDYWRDVKDYFKEKAQKREGALKKFGYAKIKKSIHEAGLSVREFDDYPPKWRISNEKGAYVDYWPTAGTIYSGKYDIHSSEYKWEKVGLKIKNLLEHHGK